MSEPFANNKREALPPFYYWYDEKKGLEESNATVRWTVAGDGLTEPNLNFRPRRKCKRVPSGVSVFGTPERTYL